MDLSVLLHLIYGNRLLLAIAVVVALVLVLRARGRVRQSAEARDEAAEPDWLLEEEEEERYFWHDWPGHDHDDEHGDR